jgi:hypothetical protein
MLRVGIKRRKADVQALRKAVSQSKADAKAREQAQKDLQKGVDQQAKQQTTLSKVRELRQKKIITIGAEWAKKTQAPLADSIIALKKVIDNAIASGLAPINTIYEATDAAVKDPAVKTLEHLTAEVANLLVDVS